MYVCHCKVVTDRTIRHAIACGARDVCAVAEVCGAGGECGGCVPVIEDLLADARRSLGLPAVRRPRRLALAR